MGAEGVEPCVFPVPVEFTGADQVFVLAGFCDLSVVHQDHSIGSTNGRESVGEKDDSPSGGDAVVGVIEQRLGVGVHGRGGFFDNQQCGVTSEGSSESDAVGLSGVEADIV